MTSFHTPQDVLRRTVIRSAVLIAAAVLATLLLSVLLFGTDPNKSVGTGYATLVFVLASVLVSGSVGVVMSYRSAVDLQRLALVRAELMRVSRTDQLTGLLNRRGFVEAAITALAKAKDERLTTTALMCDVDKFKSVNDSFGHEFGDAVLVEVGRLLSKYANQNDMIVGRHGGEEFVALLFAQDCGDAVETADAIRRECETKEVLLGAISTRVTISIGLTSSRSERPLDAMLREADQALYQAKAAGRNRVVLADLSHDSVAA
jgi:diguanylate cyclase (GGDEF)-like protein